MEFQGFKKLIKTPYIDLRVMPTDFNTAYALLAMAQRNREHFKFMYIANVKTVEDAFVFLQFMNKEHNAGDAAVYGMYLPGTDTLIGVIKVHDISWKHARGDFGYWIDADYARRGFVSAAVRALEYYFFKMGFRRLGILANVKNRASLKLARYMGYKKEGVIRSRNFNKHLNEYEDVAIFGKLQSEWGKK